MPIVQFRDGGQGGGPVGALDDLPLTTYASGSSSRSRRHAKRGVGAPIEATKLTDCQYMLWMRSFLNLGWHFSFILVLGAERDCLAWML